MFTYEVHLYNLIIRLRFFFRQRKVYNFVIKSELRDWACLTTKRKTYRLGAQYRFMHFDK